MQKLSKDLIKKLIYESRTVEKVEETGETVIYRVSTGESEETHEVPKSKEKEFLGKYQKPEITKESIKRIIREEVQTYYGAE